ncbi:hypothetical protein FISHEDRAFT_70306 [Fistulina hepatica ATCC 64428]|uniref:BTB domain-containing protein n=1 Tax=Fistulina hepatica ATCC 64428 TaxID=1128425 RepID=A0A0D7AMQ8_9AGAR|nr:hypothetical protein FISHEDRAFT_70306 [Fistulina hepatica ATCC 64428]
MSGIETQAESDTGSNVCPAFSSADSDLTLKSKDGVLFKVKKADLTASSDAFSIPSNEEEGEIVEMEESADVLELLLSFTTRRPHYPDLLGVPFEKRLWLAYAALKWQIPAVMVVCKIRHEPEFSQEPLAIFKLALAYGDQGFIDVVAPHTLTQSTEVMLKNLPDDTTFIKWVIYRDKVFDNGLVLNHFDRSKDHVNWDKIKLKFLSPDTISSQRFKFSSTLKR